MVTCPICNGNAEKHDSGEMSLFDCDRCGKFRCDTMYLSHIQWPYYEIPRHLLSAYVREHSEPNHNYVLLSFESEKVENVKGRILQDNEVVEKAKKLLLAIERKTDYPGQSVELQRDTSYPLAYCRNDEELYYYLDYLLKQGYVSGRSSIESGWYGFITVDGWRAIESYKVSNAESEKVFVAMWFHNQTNDAYNNGIQPAIEIDCGYKSMRIDRKEYLGKVDDEIIAEIRESRFIVADFTGQRHGVYFEAGFAQGLGLKVIFTCRKDYVEKLHFDTRQENHIVWETSDELRDKLKNRIRAEIGLGPHKSK